MLVYKIWSFVTCNDIIIFSGYDSFVICLTFGGSIMANLKSFKIVDLWSDTTISLSFIDNTLIMIGENGSGKTTVLRIIYEALSCRWALLAREEFLKLIIEFDNGVSVTISHKDLESASNLIIKDAPYALNGLPYSIRRRIYEVDRISDHKITYDELLELLEKHGYKNTYVYNEISNEMISKASGSKKLESIKSKIVKNFDYKIAYLPSYRRVEKKIEDFFEDADLELRYHTDEKAIEQIPVGAERFVEIAQAGMEDVDSLITEHIKRIENEYNTSASHLIYSCFSGILNKENEAVHFSKDILNEDEIKAVFGSINEDIFKNMEFDAIQNTLLEISAKTKLDDSYEQILYYYYSLLHERYETLKSKEQNIIDCFDYCNRYLVNKRIVFDTKKFKYNIFVSHNGEERIIDLEQLSSGEKQVVSIFCYMYLALEYNTLLLIDEPELSLSVLWQETFLSDIAKGAKCLGIISVTHSPFIYDNDLNQYAHSINEFIE